MRALWLIDQTYTSVTCREAPAHAAPTQLLEPDCVGTTDPLSVHTQRAHEQWVCVRRGLHVNTFPGPLSA